MSGPIEAEPTADELDAFIWENQLNERAADALRSSASIAHGILHCHDVPVEAWESTQKLRRGLLRHTDGCSLDRVEQSGRKLKIPS